MSEDRRRILALLAEGRITPEEADRLLGVLERPAPSPQPGVAEPAGSRPRYLRVEVDAREDEARAARVNVRVPMNFLRAGVRLASLLPPQARDRVNAAMARNGVPFDIDHLRPDNLEALVEMLAEMRVDVDERGAKVRVYCE